MPLPVRICRAVWGLWGRLCALSPWVSLLQGGLVGLLFLTALQAGSPTHFSKSPAAPGLSVVLCAPPEPSQSSALGIFCWAAAEGIISSAGLHPNCNHFGCKSTKKSAGRVSSAFQPLNTSVEGGPFATTPPVASHRSLCSCEQCPGPWELSVVCGFECSIWGC